MRLRLIIITLLVTLCAVGCVVEPNRGIQLVDSVIILVSRCCGLLFSVVDVVCSIGSLLLAAVTPLVSIKEQRYRNSVIVITGASSGLGADVALEAASQGATLLLAARRLDKLLEVQTLCQRAGAKQVEVLVMDTSIDLDHVRLMEAVTQKFNRMDLLVLNAGIPGPWTRFDNLTDLSMLERVMDVNYWGYVKTTRLALPLLKRSHGHIIVVSSMYGHIAAPFQAGYSASKHALTGFFDSLRQELSGEVGIIIHSPGGVATEVQSRFQTSAGVQAVLEMPSYFLASSQACARSILHAFDTHGSQAFYPPLATGLVYAKTAWGDRFDNLYFRLVDLYSASGVMTLSVS